MLTRPTIAGVTRTGKCRSSRPPRMCESLLPERKYAESMPRAVPNRGRPDYPSEAARRAATTAEIDLTRARDYLIHPKGEDERRDLSHLVKIVDETLDELRELWETLSKLGYADAPPEEFFDIMGRVDQSYVDVKVRSHINDWDPSLLGSQDEVRWSSEMRAATHRATDLGDDWVAHTRPDDPVTGRPTVTTVHAGPTGGMATPQPPSRGRHVLSSRFSGLRRCAPLPRRPAWMCSSHAVGCGGLPVSCRENVETDCPVWMDVCPCHALSFVGWARRRRRGRGRGVRGAGCGVRGAGCGDGVVF
jgi:hypothetical protein